MTALATGVSSTHTYRNISEINFILDDEKLAVTIDTERLHIRSVEATEKDVNSYASLWGDRIVMEKYHLGVTRTREEVHDYIKKVWAKGWHEKDPYQGLAIFNRTTDEFIGHIMLEHGGAPGKAELAYLTMKDHWNKKYTREAASAVVKEYGPATVEEGYMLDGKTLETIVATARPDNPYSGRVLEGLGMRIFKEEETYGALRQHYSIDLKDISNKV